MSEDIEFEAIPGLPQDLPPGERVVWQGKPRWQALARNTFKVKWLAAYFALFAAMRLVVAVEEGQNVASRLLLPLALGPACLGILSLLAWLNARSTIYTITTRRIVFRIGVAFPMTWNLPFKRLASADLTVREEGDGDIVLKVTAPNKIAWLHLWPHVQPWHFTNARPTLRTIVEPARIAALLADTMQAWAVREAAPVRVSARDAFVVVDDAAGAGDRSGSAGVRHDLLTEAGH